MRKSASPLAFVRRSAGMRNVHLVIHKFPGYGKEAMRTPGVEPGSQAWEACMMALHYVRSQWLRPKGSSSAKKCQCQVP